METITGNTTDENAENKRLRCLGQADTPTAQLLPGKLGDLRRRGGEYPKSHRSRKFAVTCASCLTEMSGKRTGNLIHMAAWPRPKRWWHHRICSYRRRKAHGASTLDKEPWATENRRKSYPGKSFPNRYPVLRGQSWNHVHTSKHFGNGTGYIYIAGNIHICVCIYTNMYKCLNT